MLTAPHCENSGNITLHALIMTTHQFFFLIFDSQSHSLKHVDYEIMNSCTMAHTTIIIIEERPEKYSSNFHTSGVVDVLSHFEHEIFGMVNCQKLA